jgi:hypothetical protein
MRPSLLRILRRLAAARRLDFEIEKRAGKGSHVRVTFGGRRTIVPRHGDLKAGTLHGILAQLGLRERDLH